jgi:hypothetical protein
MFDAAFQYIKDYRKDQELVMTNMKRSSWFAYDVDKLPELVDKVFESSVENDKWEAEYQSGKPDRMKLQVWRWMVHFQTTFRQDVREQFAVEDESSPKTPADLTRHNYAFIKGASMVYELFKQKLDAMKKGMAR